MASEESRKEIRRPKIKLPFTDKKSDMGEWAFDHRIGLCVTVIVYLVMAIVFVSAKIFVGSEPKSQGFMIDLQDLSALEELRDKLQEEVEQKQEFDWSQVSNKASNDNSLDERVVDDRGTNTAALNDEAARAQEAMEANRKAYQDAINNIAEERERSREKQEESGERRDIKRKGNVTVSYSFADPVRHAQNLVVPAYQCQGGGEVVLKAQLDRQGKVIKVEVVRGGDRCMQETATKAATSSNFNVAADAPQPHIGTITYIFIPQ